MKGNWESLAAHARQETSRVGATVTSHGPSYQKRAGSWQWTSTTAATIAAK
jgi:hypothetical protein